MPDTPIPNEAETQEVPLDEEIRLTRAAIVELTRKHRATRRLSWSVACLALLVAGISYYGRDRLADATCEGDRHSALNARAANEVVLEALRAQGEAASPEGRARIDAFIDDLHAEQDELIPIPDC